MIPYVIELKTGTRLYVRFGGIADYDDLVREIRSNPADFINFENAHFLINTDDIAAVYPENMANSLEGRNEGKTL